MKKYLLAVLALTLCFSGTAFAVPCTQGGVSGSVACQDGLPGSNNDFPAPATVNAQAFFNFDDWVYLQKYDADALLLSTNYDYGWTVNPDGSWAASTGAWSFDATVWSDFTDVMIVLKNGNSKVVEEEKKKEEEIKKVVEEKKVIEEEIKEKKKALEKLPVEKIVKKKEIEKEIVKKEEDLQEKLEKIEEIEKKKELGIYFSGYLLDDFVTSGAWDTGDKDISHLTLYARGGPAAVPEPSTMLLLGSGLVGLAWYGRRRNKTR